ncbi:hypothetical protein LCGC14_0498230 [marine sediment metagenome]|uniref:Competence protein CoiA-like family protein n=1 Tax=marine sediment metagenome TaxID=412755 RepID=A0A0F9S9V6_9ZZZZ|nr:hypothetical protein [bacterium]
MIYALNDQNERINALNSDKGKTYYCPNLECNNRELIFKKGEIRIEHFAHKSQKDCSSEPESEAHILCKNFFQTLFDLDKKFVEYYGIKGVRPDVLYGQFALEIQCSPIAVNEVKRRNKIYEKNGYIAIWIFLENEFKPIKKNEGPKAYYRVKKSVLRGSFEDIGRRNFKFFSFKCENEDIHINFNDFVDVLFEFTKENELEIDTKQDFDGILEKILILIKNKKELHNLKKKLNSLPKQIQGQMYEGSYLDFPHLSAYDFYDGVNNFTIDMFIDDIFSEKDCSMEEFKGHIENMIVEASIRISSFKDWRVRNTLKRNGKTYIPLCRIQKIYHETPKAYLIYFNHWIPKSISYKDDKYLYCEEWMYKKIEVIDSDLNGLS